MTPESTIDAILYGLRRGLTGLDDSRSIERLKTCDRDAMKEIVRRLRNPKGPWKWGKPLIEKLVTAWKAIGGGK